MDAQILSSGLDSWIQAARSGDKMNDLFQIPADQRDDQWKQSFYETVIDASFACRDPQVFSGPDGFPYFALMTPEPMKSFESYCLCNLVEFATDDGFGVAINPTETGADWVFTYGDLVTIRMFNSFEVPVEKRPPEHRTEILDQDEQVLLGSPSEEFLPGYVRAVLRRFLVDGVGLQDPQVLLMNRPFDSPTEQLVFSIYPEDFETEEIFNFVMGRITWFLPRHYPVVSVGREAELENHFQ